MIFNDFSRFKNNELRNYFLKKELNNYLEKRKRDNSLRSPIIGALFSSVTLAILWSAKDSKEKLLSLFSNSDFGEYYYLKVILTVIASFTVLFYLYKFLAYLLSKFTQFISKIINTYVLLNYNFLGSQKKFEKQKLEIFKYEIANQISLALSLVSHIDSKSEEKLDNENKFYAIEAYHYLSNSLTKLNFDILKTPYKNKIKNTDYLDLNYNRVQDLLDLSKDIKGRIESFWKQLKLSTNYNAEIKNLNSLINRIQEEITNASDISEK